MDVYELRRKTHVRDYYLDSLGGCIIYVSITEKENTIFLPRDIILQELIAIGSLDESIHDEKLFETYELSQWDALNISIRHELAKEQEKDLGNSDIFKAIANLIKPANEQGDAY